MAPCSSTALSVLAVRLVTTSGSVSLSIITFWAAAAALVNWLISEFRLLYAEFIVFQYLTTSTAPRSNGDGTSRISEKGSGRWAQLLLLVELLSCMSVVRW